MRHWIALVLPLVIASRLDAQNPDSSAVGLSKTVIEEAIARGRSAKKWEGVEIKPGLLSLASGAFSVALEGPLNRIANESAQRTRKYLAFTLDSIPRDLLEPTIQLVATPRDRVNTIRNGRQIVTPPATHAVMVSGLGPSSVVIQPTRVEFFDVEVTGMEDGGRPIPKDLRSKGIRASFPLALLPPGPFQVRVITAEKEFQIDVDAKKRAMLR